LGLARPCSASRAPVRARRRSFRQGALASSRRCFSTSSIRSPLSLLSLARNFLTCYSHPQLVFPLSCLPCAALGLPRLGLGPTSQPTTVRSESSSSMMAVPLYPTATAQSRALAEQIGNPVSRAGVDVSNHLSL
jgi:hypothetical protein